MNMTRLKRAAAVFAAAGLVFSGGGAFAQELKVSGLLDSKASYSAGAGDTPDAALTIEEYANLRIEADIRERAVFYGAFNLIAAAGTAAASLAASASAAPVRVDNYVAAIELERLYFRLNGDYVDIDAGLMRMAFGYGQVWGPMDFLNHRDPRFPDARKRGVLGASVAAFPGDAAKILVFGAAVPQLRGFPTGAGSKAGLTGEWHGDRISLQGLYAYEVPQDPIAWGIHRAGFSLKAEAGAGFMVEALYTYSDERESWEVETEGPSGGTAGYGAWTYRDDRGGEIKGLSASAGFDYSFYDGKFYTLAEYLYSGSASSTGSGLRNRNYGYALIRYSWNDYTNTGLSCMVCFDDWSFSPIVTTDYEVFQGFTLSFSAQAPLDRAVFSGGGGGELGPENAGSRFLLTAKARLRF